MQLKTGLLTAGFWCMVSAGAPDGLHGQAVHAPTIAAARAVAGHDSVAPAVQIVGVVSMLPNDQGRGFNTYVQDSTAGVRVYWRREVMGGDVGPGDVLLIRGRMGMYRRAPRLTADSITLLRRGEPPVPLVVTPGSILAGHHEGRLVQVNGDVQLALEEDESEYDVYVKGAGGAVRVRVEDEYYQMPGFSDLLHAGSRMHAIGVARRSASSDSLTDYRIYPRSYADVVLLAKPDTGQLIGLGVLIMLVGLVLHLALQRRSAERHACDLSRTASDLQRSEAALRHGEARFRAIIEQSFGLVAIFRPGGELAYATPAAAGLFDYCHEARPAFRQFWRSLHRADRRTTAQSLRYVLGAPGESTMLEFRLNVSGEYRSVGARLTNLVADPAVNGLVLHGRDVTEQRAAECALAESRQQLEQAQRLDALGRLAGGVAHDFNNLLTVIGGNADILLEDMSCSSAGADELREIKHSAQRAAEMTRKLLTFGRGHLTETTRVDVRARVQSMEGVIRRLMPEHINLNFETSQRAVVDMNAAHLDQLLLNLLVNARDAVGTHGTISIRVNRIAVSRPRQCRTGVMAPGEYICLSVQDNGVGMDETVLSHMFEPFFTTKPVGEGTGLGLSTVYGVVAQSSGHMSVTSSPGAGTTFNIFLPASQAVADCADQREGRTEAIAARVLVVEDQAEVRKYVTRVLKRRGFDVQEADSGQRALEIYERGDARPDVIVSDLVMPGMTGHELAATVRAQRPDMPFVFVSGYAPTELPSHAEFNAQHTVFRAKPFAPDELVSAIGEALASRTCPKAMLETAAPV